MAPVKPDDVKIGGTTMRKGKTRVTQIAILSLIAFCVVLPRGWTATPAEIEQFISKIESADAETRHKAFESAADMGVQAIEPLGKPLANPDKAIAKAAEIALEKIVGRATRPGADDERRAASESLLNLAQRPYPATVRNCALKFLGLAGGSESVPGLSRLLEEAEAREMARWALERIPGEASCTALTDAIAAAADTRFRCALIKTVGAKKCARAVPVLIKEAKSSDAEVRMEAVDALARTGELAAEPPIAGALKSDTARERNRAFDAYLRLADAQLPKQREAALKVYERALELAANDGERCAAIVGIGRVGMKSSIDQLVKLLQDPNPAVRNAAAQSLMRMPEPESTRSILKQLGSAGPSLKSALLRVLAAKAGAEGADAIRKALTDPSAEVRVTALELSGKLEDASAEPTLLEAARSGSDMVRPVALAAYMRLADARLKQHERTQALEMYHRALDLAERNEERTLALQGVATIGDPSSLPWVTQLLDTPGIGNEARAASVSIADTLAASGKKEKAIEIYNAAFEKTADRGLMARAAAGLRKLGVKVAIAERNGFITDWLIVGPFPNENRAAWDVSYFPEQEIKLDKEYQTDGRTVRWQEHYTDDPQGIVNLAQLLEPRANVAAYAYATLESKVDLAGGFLIGSDDDVICWLNGQRAHAFKGDRGLAVDQDKFPVQLRAGTNEILVKVLQGTGDWGFCLRVVARNGRPLSVEKLGPGTFKFKQ